MGLRKCLYFRQRTYDNLLGNISRKNYLSDQTLGDEAVSSFKVSLRDKIKVPGRENIRAVKVKTLGDKVFVVQEGSA